MFGFCTQALLSKFSLWRASESTHDVEAHTRASRLATVLRAAPRPQTSSLACLSLLRRSRPVPNTRAWSQAKGPENLGFLAYSAFSRRPYLLSQTIGNLCTRKELISQRREIILFGNITGRRDVTVKTIHRKVWIYHG